MSNSVNPSESDPAPIDLIRQRGLKYGLLLKQITIMRAG